MMTTFEIPLEVRVGQLLRRHNLSLATAESCTGGLIGHKLTNVPGSSDYYLGGMVAYSYEAKERVLGVRHNTLYDYGAVSPETALEMARGARRLLHADLAISVTGIAGPGGGLPDKPVGLVYVALSTRHNEMYRRYVWSEDREGNKELSARAALQLLVDYLAERAED